MYVNGFVFANQSFIRERLKFSPSLVYMKGLAEWDIYPDELKASWLSFLLWLVVKKELPFLPEKKEGIVGMPMLEEGCIPLMQDYLLLEQLVPTSEFLTSSSFVFFC